MCAASFDYLIGTREERRRNFETDSFRSLKIDNEVELRRLLHRQVSRLGSLENSIYILGRAAKLIVPIDTVGYQAADCYGLGKRMDIGHSIPMCQGDDQ